MEYGKVVDVSEKLVRAAELRPSEVEGSKSNLRWKIWKRRKFSARCIFLGFRFLRNGRTYWENEVGYIFDTHETVEAALVSPGPNKNPVYVPVDTMKEVKGER